MQPRSAVINTGRAASCRTPRDPGHADRSERAPDDGLGGRDDAMDTRDRKPFSEFKRNQPHGAAQNKDAQIASTWSFLTSNREDFRQLISIEIFQFHLLRVG